MKPLASAVIALLICQGLQSQSRADDWPQWLGPLRDSHWREDGILYEFPQQGPAVKWRLPISGGYAGPAVAQGRVYVTDFVTAGKQTPDPDKRSQISGVERVLCVDAESGSLVWKHEYKCDYNISYASGPRCTPTVDGDYVYALGAEGDLRCLKSKDGGLVWQKNFKRDFGAETPIWGFSGHPLIDGDRILCVAGGKAGTAVALDKKTGELIWGSLDAQQIGYCPPTIVEAGGTRQLLIWHAESLNSLNPETGEPYWSEPLSPDYGMAITTPRLSDNLLFVGGINNKSMLLRLDARRPTASVLWYGEKGKGIDPVHSTPYAEEGHLYGVDRQGQLCCVELETGRIRWSTFDLMPGKRRVHSGTVFVIRTKDRFFLYNDSGELVIADLTPERYKEIGRAKILETTGTAFGRPVVWSHPAFSNRCMFTRNDNELVCVSLSNGDQP